MALRPATIASTLLVAAATACSAGSNAPRATPTTASTTQPTASVRDATAPATAPTPRVTVARAGWALPAARSREVVVATSSGLLVAGGLSSARVSTDSVWLVDPATGRVRSTGRLATAVHDATGFALGAAAYVVGGGSASTVSTVQRLSPGRTAATVGRLPRPRSDLVSTVVGDTGYVLGGFDGVRSLPEVLSTHDGRRFAVVARLPVPVRYAAVAAVGGRLFVFGGEHDGVGTSIVQQVDPASGTARVIARLPTALAHESAFVSAGAVWLAGGRDHAQLERTVWRWDPATRRATRAGRLPYAVADAGATVIGGVGYLVGGEASAPMPSVVLLRFRA